MTTLADLKSHPYKTLLCHTDGVVKNVRSLTALPEAELIAMMHDLGKMNPNFQKKLSGAASDGSYSSHAYFSAYVFYVLCAHPDNLKKISAFLNKKLTSEDTLALVVLIAKHHGNLPDFQPSRKGDEASTHILSEREIEKLHKFFNANPDLPIDQFASHYLSTASFQQFVHEEKVKKAFLNRFIFEPRNNAEPLDFFLKYQLSFACLLQADKADAATLDNFIQSSQKDMAHFQSAYQTCLNSYLKNLNQDTPLNQLRTKIREEAVGSLRQGITQKRRVFELTAPTGSGKTLMMLALAGQITTQLSENYRIIYALPFLSITEQVEKEVLTIFEPHREYIQRVDSKAENERFEEIQEALDNDPNEEILKELSWVELQENTFSYPFVITTFVRLFETLLSNRNAALLKLPNFSKCIFLIDEVQTLPPRLYGFFIAYLTRFCELFDSYAIISTATQPNFLLPDKDVDSYYVKFAKDFFPNYQPPFPLLSTEHFQNDLFNRYQISYRQSEIELKELGDLIIEEQQSLLVILNTIEDTRDLYRLLEGQFQHEELHLLNTHFTPNDRKRKIQTIKDRLEHDKLTILISTQLIEAGVDIDFPVLYRDFATIPSIVQSAGRCNRNGKLSTLGQVYFFHLVNKGKNRANLIYRGKDKELLGFTQKALAEGTYSENSLFKLQKSFFDSVQSELHFAKHTQNSPSLNFDFLRDIQEVQYGKIGKFRLIDRQVYGEEVQYFVPEDENDDRFEQLLVLQEELFEAYRNKNTNQSELRLKKKKLKNFLKSIAGDIVQVRLKTNQARPLLSSEKNYFDLYKISDLSYNEDRGVTLSEAVNII